MTFYQQPEKELSPEERLLAAVISLNHRIPCGFQIGLPMHLDAALAAVETLFTEHNLSMREELIGELTSWRSHVEHGLKFAQQCDHLMQLVIRQVDSTIKRY